MQPTTTTDRAVVRFIVSLAFDKRLWNSSEVPAKRGVFGPRLTQQHDAFGKENFLIWAVNGLESSRALAY